MGLRRLRDSWFVEVSSFETCLSFREGLYIHIFLRLLSRVTDGSNVPSSPGSTTLPVLFVCPRPSPKESHHPLKMRLLEGRLEWNCTAVRSRNVAPLSVSPVTRMSGLSCKQGEADAANGQTASECCVGRSVPEYDRFGTRKTTCGRKFTRNSRSDGYTSMLVKRLGIVLGCTLKVRYFSHDFIGSLLR